MGITLGTLLCVLTLNYLVLVKPLPYPDQNKLFVTNHVLYDKNDELQTRENSTQSVITFYKENTVFSSSATIYYSWSLIETHPAQPLVNTIETVPEYFKMFSVPMIKGRAFEHTEDIDKRHAVAVISYKAWQKHFNGTADILEKKIDLAGMSYQIIGVIDKRFVEPQIYGIGRETEVWLPWDVPGNLSKVFDKWNTYDAIVLVGKLNKDINSVQAEHKLTPILNELWQDDQAMFKNKKGWRTKVELTAIKEVIIGGTKFQALLMLTGVIALVLIACTNVINLMMARTAEMQKQLAIHAAIGAKRSHLHRLIFSETSILMFAAMLLALLISSIGFEVMRTYLSEILPRVNELGLHRFTLISAFMLALGLAYILAKVSSQLIDYKSLNSQLTGSGKGIGIQVSKKIRNTLMIVQVTMASLLLFTNINLFQQAVVPIFQEKGFSTEELYDLYLPPNKLPFLDVQGRNAFVVEIKRIFSESPAVEFISHSSHIYNAARLNYFTVLNNGKGADKNISATVSKIDEHYFDMIGQPILQGDYFSINDIRSVYKEKSGQIEKNENKVVIVNQAFTKKIQPDGMVLNSLIQRGDSSPFRIIGIVKDRIHAPLTKGEPRVFTPSTESGFSFIIKYHHGQALSREQIVSMVKQAGSRNPPYEYESVSEKHLLRLFPQITTSITTIALSIIVLFLVAIGLYGIVNYSTQLRQFELGTRLAIGAKRNDLVKLILVDNLKPILVGLGISIFIILGLVIIFPNELGTYVSLKMIPMFLGTVILISLISLIACYLPLRQYINQTPIHSLRGYN